MTWRSLLLCGLFLLTAASATATQYVDSLATCPEPWHQSDGSSRFRRELREVMLRPTPPLLRR